MSTASNTIETRFFTLFVPPVVAVYVPHRMVGSGRAASLTVPVVGGLPFLVGAARPGSAVVTGSCRINRNPLYTSVLAAVFGQSPFYQRSSITVYGVFLFACFPSLRCSLRRAHFAHSIWRRIRGPVSPCAALDTAVEVV